MSCQLTLLPRAGAGPGGEFTLEDGAQSARLYAPQRDLLAAAFTQLLIANCGGEDSFKVRRLHSRTRSECCLLKLVSSHRSRTYVLQNKQEFFYSEMRKAHARHPHDKLPLRVVRAELVRSSLRATRHFTVADWCRNFDITFQGEQGGCRAPRRLRLPLPPPPPLTRVCPQAWTGAACGASGSRWCARSCSTSASASSCPSATRPPRSCTPTRSARRTSR